MDHSKDLLHQSRDWKLKHNMYKFQLPEGGLQEEIADILEGLNVAKRHARAQNQATQFLNSESTHT